MRELNNQPICPRCMGSGLYRKPPFPDEKPCAACGGTGKVLLYCAVCGNSELAGHERGCPSPNSFTDAPPVAPGEQPPFPPKITVSTGAAPGCTAQALERMGKWIEFDAPPTQERASDERELLIAKLTAIVDWLKKNQPDVFKRGLWDVIPHRLAAQPSPQGKEDVK